MRYVPVPASGQFRNYLHGNDYREGRVDDVEPLVQRGRCWIQGRAADLRTSTAPVETGTADAGDPRLRPHHRPTAGAGGLVAALGMSNRC
jgi:hypothetical protein